MKRTHFLQKQRNSVAEIINSTRYNQQLSSDELNSKVDENSWSILQCYDHLNLYNHYYIAELEKAIDLANPKHDEFEIQFSWIGKKSINMMHPSNRKRQKTFKKMIPATSSLSLEVIKTFLNDQERIHTLITCAEKKDINQKLVRVEFFRLLKMNIAETIEFILVHEQRHLLQIRTILDSQRLLVSDPR